MSESEIISTISVFIIFSCSTIIYFNMQCINNKYIYLEAIVLCNRLIYMINSDIYWWEPIYVTDDNIFR